MLYKKEIKLEMETDVLIAGGGPAGFAAAIASARNGAKTLLIEQNSMLGGMATAGLVGPFMSCYDNDGKEQVVKGIFDELCIRAEEEGGAIHPSKVQGLTSYSSFLIKSHRHVTPFLSETMEMVMEKMCEEAGVQILYNVRVCDVIHQNEKISGVVAAVKEGLAVFRAKLYIDCTGDADVAWFAEVPTWMGDEKNGISQPCTLFFEIEGMDRDKFMKDLDAHKEQLGIPNKNCWSWYLEKARKNGDWDIERNEVGNYETPIQGRWKINTTRMAYVNATSTKEVTKALIEGRRQAREIMKFYRKYVPGCENIRMVEMATALGVRETRHIKGKYLLTADDIMKRKHFDDAICTFGYAIDIHNSDGGGGVFTEVNEYYTIPFRCLIPEKCDNLLVAGRSISGTSEAAASYRVMPCCMATGQAAGTAAAIALKDRNKVADVEVDKLRETLISQGAVIKE